MAAIISDSARCQQPQSLLALASAFHFSGTRVGKVGMLAGIALLLRLTFKTIAQECGLSYRPLKRLPPGDRFWRGFPPCGRALRFPVEDDLRCVKDRFSLRSGEAAGTA